MTMTPCDLAYHVIYLHMISQNGIKGASAAGAQEVAWQAARKALHKIFSVTGMKLVTQVRLMKLGKSVKCPVQVLTDVMMLSHMMC